MGQRIKLSASAIKCFKACPLRYYGTYDQGIRRIEDTEAQRIGTNWHSIMEIAHDEDAVVAHLNERYSNVPDYLDKEKLEIERIRLLYSLIGYNWYYQGELEKVLGTEIEFELPVINPKTNRQLRYVTLQGKIDKLIEINGRVYVKEHKSTSSSVDPDSRLWKALGLDTQTSLYVYAARRLGYNVAGVYYDVWHKPQISPKKLTQTESKQFVETGKYCGQDFEVEQYKITASCSRNGIYVNDVPTITEPGAKEGTFTIRETSEMYGARLLADIVERPEFYFACKELTKTDQQTERFEWELFNVYKTIRNMKKTGHWYGNESQCEATFQCDFIESCYNNKPISVEDMPEGMQCIFGDKENE